MTNAWNTVGPQQTDHSLYLTILRNKDSSVFILHSAWNLTGSQSLLFGDWANSEEINNYTAKWNEPSTRLHMQGCVMASHLTLNSIAIQTVKDDFYSVGIGEKLEHSLIQREEHKVQVLGGSKEARP